MLRRDTGIFHVENRLRAGYRIGAVSLQFDCIDTATLRRIDQTLGLVECGEVAADLGDDVATVCTIISEHEITPYLADTSRCSKPQ